MSVFVPIPITSVEEKKILPSRTYRMDPETGRIAGMIDGVDAVQQAIRKALQTPRFKCLAYSNQYGSEIKDTVIAGDATPAYVAAEMPRLVRDALAPDNRILEIRGFSFEFEGDKAYVSFTASTVFGDTTIEEVI